MDDDQFSEVLELAQTVHGEERGHSFAETLRSISEMGALNGYVEKTIGEMRAMAATQAERIARSEADDLKRIEFARSAATRAFETGQGHFLHAIALGNPVASAQILDSITAAGWQLHTWTVVARPDGATAHPLFVRPMS